MVDILEIISEHDRAFFGIYKHGKGSDESYIKASKHGLILFAAELLKAVRDSNGTNQFNGNTKIPIDYLQEWFDIKADTFIQYIEVADKMPSSKTEPPHKLSFKDKMIPAFFIFIGLILLFLLIVGVWTTCKWIF